MRRRNHRTKAAETLKKTDRQFGFTVPDPSTSRSHLDLKRRRKVTFVDVDHRSPLNDSSEAQTGRSLDAKTSEFAFFKKLKSDFGLCSESSDSKSSSFQVRKNSKTLESRSKPGAKVQTGLGKDHEAKDGCKGYSFSTPIHTTRGGSCVSSISHVNLNQRDKEKDSGKSCLAFSRDEEDSVRSGNNLRSGGISEEKDDIFSVKRKKLNQWVKDIWFPDFPELKSNGQDLVSVLLTRLFPGTEDTHSSRFSKDRADRRKGRTFLDSPGSKISHESYTEVDESLQMERDRHRSISLRGFLGNSIAPSLQFPTSHIHSSFTPRDPEEISYHISYPEDKRSLYRPSLLKQRTSLSFPVEDALDCSPISSVHLRNYEPLSLDYHREESGYGSKDLSHDHREHSSALLLEWNSETASTRPTDDFPHTKLITYPNASSSSLTNNPWSCDYSSSHDLITRELHPLPLISHYSSDCFLLPETRPTSYFEHQLERYLTTDDKDVVAANLNLQTFHHTNNSDCLTKDYTYYHNISNSPRDLFPSKVPACEIVPFPISRISNPNLLEASSPPRTERFKSHDWRPFQFQSPEAWID